MAGGKGALINILDTEPAGTGVHFGAAFRQLVMDGWNSFSPDFTVDETVE